jgi:6-phosphogluconolactonase
MKALRLFRLLAVAAIPALAACSNAGGTPISPIPQSAAAGRTSGGTAYLYVENANDTLSGFSIAASGALTALPGSPYPSNTTGASDFAIAVNPRGPLLYTTGSVSNNVAVFAIGNDGELTAGSDSTPGGGGAGATVMTKSDQRLYVVDGSASAIAAFDASKKGKLTAVAGSPYGVTCPGFCDANPSSAVISGSYLYSVDAYGWYVSSFSVAADGSLTELNSYATHYGPQDAVMTPNGKYLYVTNGASADISVYSVAGGVLAQLKKSPFSAGNQPAGIAISPNGKLLYVANYGDGTISGYAIAGGGTPKPLAGSPFADGTGTGPTAVAIDQSGEHLFVSNQSSDAIAVYAIGTSGTLTPVSGSPFAVSGGLYPRGLALYQP